MKNDAVFESIYKTRWSLISEARNVADPAKSRRAIEEVIKRYQPAILGYLRRNGIVPADCEDACQEFLVNVFLTNTLPRANREIGRFRTFLLRTLRCFRVDYLRRMSAEKRGANVVQSLEDLSPDEASDALGFEEPRRELEFELEFAFCVHQRVLVALAREYSSDSKAAVYAALCPHLLEKKANLDEIVAGNLGMNEAAVRKALSRLRHRYGEKFYAEVAEIIDEGDELQEEAKELLKLVLVRSRMLATAEE